MMNKKKDHCTPVTRKNIKSYFYAKDKFFDNDNLRKGIMYGHLRSTFYAKTSTENGIIEN